MRNSRTTGFRAARVSTVGRDCMAGFTGERARVRVTPMRVRDVGHARSVVAVETTSARLPAKPETAKLAAGPGRIR